MSNKIRISHYEKSTQVLGPGNRFVVWFQGCKKNCSGCINPEGRLLDGGYEIEVYELVKIVGAIPNIQGITISGGEPFLQFCGLKELVYLIKENTNLDVMLFSGYQYSEIVKRFNENNIKNFFSLIDIFIDGEYIEDLNENQMFRGSANQNVYFFTNKYKNYESQILNAQNRNIEFTLDKHSNVFMVGIPPKGFYEKFVLEIREGLYDGGKE